MKELLERLAELEHEQWVHWSKALAMQENISEERRKRWEQYWVPYSDLPEDVKESDRRWARRILEIVGRYFIELYDELERCKKGSKDLLSIVDEQSETIKELVRDLMECEKREGK